MRAYEGTVIGGTVRGGSYLEEVELIEEVGAVVRLGEEVGLGSGNAGGVSQCSRTQLEEGWSHEYGLRGYARKNVGEGVKRVARRAIRQRTSKDKRCSDLPGEAAKRGLAWWRTEEEREASPGGGGI